MKSLFPPRHLSLPVLIGLLPATAVLSADTSQPITAADVVFVEKNGLLVFEAEHFFAQDLADVRAWHVTSADRHPGITPDADHVHLDSANAGAHIEALPDTRATLTPSTTAATTRVPNRKA